MYSPYGLELFGNWRNLCEHLRTYTPSDHLHPFPVFSLDTQVTQIANALRSGYADIAAQMLKTTLDGILTDKEPVGNVGTSGVQRPILHLVWSKVAYLYWIDADQVALRKLSMDGMVLPEMVLDMLYYASTEAADVPATKAAYDSFVRDMADDTSITYASAHGTGTQRIFCHAEKRKMMFELIQIHNVCLDPDSIMMKTIVRNIVETLNAPFLKFLKSLNCTPNLLEPWRNAVRSMKGNLSPSEYGCLMYAFDDPHVVSCHTRKRKAVPE